MLSTPFWHPLLLLGNPSLTTQKILPYLLGNPSFVSWREFPSTLVRGWLYTDPPHSPLPHSPSQQFPLLNACPRPLKMTLRYRLYIVRYSYHQFLNQEDTRGDKPPLPPLAPSPTSCDGGKRGLYCPFQRQEGTRSFLPAQGFASRWGPWLYHLWSMWPNFLVPSCQLPVFFPQVV